MEKYSLDSSFLIDYLQGKEHARKRYSAIESSSVVAIPSLARAEVERGLDVESGLAKLGNIPFGDEEIRRTGKFFGYLDEQGNEMKAVDVLIAATAAANHSILLTCDADFEKLVGGEDFRVEIIGQ
ncbi:MAG: type II toxin-antitoxin system VapC family toxin [Candidatus Aenigmatarchaeota archaeon]